MYSSFQLAVKYLKYYSTASNKKGHGIHSPFIFNFILHVLNNKSHYQLPVELETLRRQLLSDTRKISSLDLGAGSRKEAKGEREVAKIAATALQPKKYASILYRLIKYYQPHHIVELGTSLGLTTAYLATANPGANITTIEGNPAIATIAKENFRKLQLDRIQLKEGNFDDLLPGVIASMSIIDLAYIDGNHQYAPTIAYFNQILKIVHSDSILVFDDIHWSIEMDSAWKQITSHPSVQYSVDIFFMGFVFFKKEFKEKQKFIIRV